MRGRLKKTKQHWAVGSSGPLGARIHWMALTTTLVSGWSDRRSTGAINGSREHGGGGVEEVTIMRESHPSSSWGSEWERTGRASSAGLPAPATENLTPCRPSPEQGWPALGLGGFCASSRDPRRLSVSSLNKNSSAPGQAGSRPEPSRQGTLTVQRHLVCWEKQPLIAQDTAASTQRSG